MTSSQIAHALEVNAAATAVQRPAKSELDLEPIQRPWLWIALATAFGLAARTFRLDHPVMWVDELTTFIYTEAEWSSFAGSLARLDVHPPLYYMLQKAWRVFGDSVFAMRTLPVLLGTACIPLLFILARRLLGTRVGVVSAFLLSTAPLHVFQSRELRMYSLLNLFALLALVGLAYALPALSAGARRTRSLSHWALYVIGSVGAFYAQSTALLLPVLATGLVGWMASRGRAERKTLLHLLLANLLILLAIQPWLAILANHVQKTLQEFWIPYPSLQWARSQFMGVYPYVSYLKPVMYALILGGAWVTRRYWVPFGFILTFAVGQPVVMWALSYLRPVLIVRALVWPSTLTLMLPAALIARIKQPAFMAVATAVFMTAQALGLLAHYPGEIEAPEVTALRPHLRAFNKRSDRLLLAHQSFEQAIRFYAPEILADTNVLAMTHGDIPLQLEPIYKSQRVDRAQLFQSLTGIRRVWVFAELKPRFAIAPAADVAPVIEQLRARGLQVGFWTSGNLSLSLIEMR